MPNTASAAKQARASARRHERNQQAVSRLRSIRKKFLASLSAGKKDEATALYRNVVSALDKAAASGIIHKNAASRSKARLGAQLKAAA